MLERLNQPITLKRPTLKRPSRAGASRPAKTTRSRSSATVVGLDIQPGEVVAARVRVDGGVHVEQAAVQHLAPEIVRDGEVADVEALSAELRELFTRSKLPKRVRIGVANQRIVLRRIELPPISDSKELANAIRFKAQDEIPMPLDSVVLDFHALGITDTPAGPRQQVVLVAARRDMVERLLQAARGAGLKPEGVDLSAFAMIRALRPAEAPPEERVLYLAVGGLTNLAIAEGRTCQFTRVIGGGLEQIIADVAERCALPVAEARSLVAGLDLDADSAGELEQGPALEQGLDNDAALRDPAAAEPSAAADGGGSYARTQHEQTALAVLHDSLRRLAAEVRNSLDFHQGQETGGEITRAVLCGPALDLPGFHRALSAELGLPVTAGSVGFPSANGDVPTNSIAIAAGLAIEEGSA